MTGKVLQASHLFESELAYNKNRHEFALRFYVDTHFPPERDRLIREGLLVHEAEAKAAVIIAKRYVAKLHANLPDNVIRVQFSDKKPLRR